MPYYEIIPFSAKNCESDEKDDKVIWVFCQDEQRLSQVCDKFDAMLREIDLCEDDEGEIDFRLPEDDFELISLLEKDQSSFMEIDIDFKAKGTRDDIVRSLEKALSLIERGYNQGSSHGKGNVYSYVISTSSE